MSHRFPTDFPQISHRFQQISTDFYKCPTGFSTDVPQLSHSFPTDVPQISHRFHTDFTQMSHRFPIDFPQISHRFHTDFTQMSHRCHTDLIQIWYRLHTVFTQISHRDFTQRFPGSTISTGHWIQMMFLYDKDQTCWMDFHYDSSNYDHLPL